MHIRLGGSVLAIFVLGTGSYLFGQAVPQNFVSVTPCRIADTRPSSGGAGPIPVGTYRNFAIAGLCGIPTSAAAFSLNVTALPPSGSSLLYLSVLPAQSSTPTSAPSSSTLNDPLGTIVANAAIVPSGVNGAIEVYVSGTSDVILDINGYFADQTVSSNDSTALGTGAGGSSGDDNTAVGFNALTAGTGGGNTAIGYRSLSANTSGASNTAVGSDALFRNTSGGYNSAFGNEALAYNTTGVNNDAFGSGTLEANTTGEANVAFGNCSLQHNTTGLDNSALGACALWQNTAGQQNTAVGIFALGDNTAGQQNTAVGANALGTTTGNNNIGLGADAGTQVTTGQWNIEIGNPGVASDNGVIRLGSQGIQSAIYLAGVSYATVFTGAAVLVSSSGQLGVQSSSIRFKENVHDMGDGSDALMQLRPVEFQYKQPEADGSKPLQFGLVAEEVAKVYPELVVRNKDGQIDTVQYHQLPAMLLNEIQKQHRTIEDQQGRLGNQQQEIQELKADMEKLRALVMNK